MVVVENEETEYALQGVTKGRPMETAPAVFVFLLAIKHILTKGVARRLRE